MVPEDEATEKWLNDQELHQALFEFDEQLKQLMYPYWSKIYLKEEVPEQDPNLPFTSSEAPELKPRF